MIKALIVITLVSGAEYTAKLPTMEQCMKETVRVEKQNDVKSASCIPRTEDRVAADIFSQFMDMFMMLSAQKEGCMENYYPPKEGLFNDELERDGGYRRSPSS